MKEITCKKCGDTGARIFFKDSQVKYSDHEFTFIECPVGMVNHDNLLVRIAQKLGVM
jgi:hypothetical protein